VRLSGAPLPGHGLGDIADRQKELDAFIAELAPEPSTAAHTARSNGHAPDWQPPQISPVRDDAAILARARAGRYGAAFSPLYDHGEWDGDRAWARDGSDSGKDHFLVSELCYWTQDPEQIERLMRSSALRRDKYDESHHGHSNAPYLEELIAQCLAKKERHWSDGPSPSARDATMDAATPTPNGHNGCHGASESGSAGERAWEQLARNPYLVPCERNVLPALLTVAGYHMGEQLPERVPIGFITPEMRRASGICRRY
jgi:hypothetical protein